MTTNQATLATKSSAFPFLSLPFELRQAIYTAALSTIISITDSRLSRSPALEEIAFLASRRGSWNLCLVCRLIYTETLHQRWENLTLALSRDGTRADGDDGRHRLGNADQAFRRRVRSLIVSDPECFGMCYGLGRLEGLRTLTVRVDRVDGLLLDRKLMADAPEGDWGKAASRGMARGTTLKLAVRVVPAPPWEVGMFTSAETTGAEVQMRWRREAVGRGKKHAYLWLSDAIPHLPGGCQVTIQADVTTATWETLKDLEGFRVTSAGRDKWVLVYDGEMAS